MATETESPSSPVNPYSFAKRSGLSDVAQSSLVSESVTRTSNAIERSSQGWMVNSTGIVAESIPLSAMTMMMSWWIPIASPAGSSEATIVSGVIPLVGMNESHALPSACRAVHGNAPAPSSEISKVRVRGAVLPTAATATSPESPEMAKRPTVPPSKRLSSLHVERTVGITTATYFANRRKERCLIYRMFPVKDRQRRPLLLLKM